MPHLEGRQSRVWDGSGRSGGEKLDGFVQPVVAVEAKVELDTSRLKTSLASFLLIKGRHSHAKCFLVYIAEEVDSPLLRLTELWIDGFYRFSAERDETAAFVDSVQGAVKRV